MDILLDTHVIIWALSDDKRLSAEARALISKPDNMIYYSTASLWELAIKNYKAPEKCPYNEEIVEDLCRNAGYHSLDINFKHIRNLRRLEIKEGTVLSNHDPFDRLLLSQAKTEGFSLLSHDSNFDNYNEQCIIKI